MDEQMRILVNMLKESVSNNLHIIKQNELQIRSILQQPISAERSSLLAEKFNLNKKLLEENHDSLNLELQIINYLNKYRELIKQNSKTDEYLSDQSKDDATESFEQDDAINENHSDDLLALTFKGEIPFNSLHPKFNDDEFFNTLLERYKQSENYEMCSMLVKLKGKK